MKWGSVLLPLVYSTRRGTLIALDWRFANSACFECVFVWIASRAAKRLWRVGIGEGLLHLLDDCVPVLEVGWCPRPAPIAAAAAACLSVCLCVCVISLWRDRAGGVSRPSPGPCRSCIGLALGGCLRCPQCPHCLPPPRPLPPQRRSPESDLPPHPHRAPRPLLPPCPRSRFQICQTDSCCCGLASDRLLQECLQTGSRCQHFFFHVLTK